VILQGDDDGVGRCHKPVFLNGSNTVLRTVTSTSSSVHNMSLIWANHSLHCWIVNIIHDSQIEIPVSITPRPVSVGHNHRCSCTWLTSCPYPEEHRLGSCAPMLADRSFCATIVTVQLYDATGSFQALQHQNVPDILFQTRIIHVCAEHWNAVATDMPI
jgi:hypothetical protein